MLHTLESFFTVSVLMQLYTTTEDLSLPLSHQFMHVLPYRLTHTHTHTPAYAPIYIHTYTHTHLPSVLLRLFKVIIRKELLDVHINALQLLLKVIVRFLQLLHEPVPVVFLARNCRLSHGIDLLGLREGLPVQVKVVFDHIEAEGLFALCVCLTQSTYVWCVCDASES